ncbi:PIG-X [Thelonectria olida]|uniref:Protein PBN1 n=1 Tax=Thelonectria olida TaxID=1576542 RepID=A0A9P8W4F3_9HYPO|nr:PIG-X [Thelonectria olida]
MRERITYVHEDINLDPKSLDIQEAGLLGPLIDTTRQDRLTIPFGELPSELAELLKTFDRLHVRWASPKEYNTLDPFTSRISPGIHVSYTPSRPGDTDPTQLCTWLQRSFGTLACHSPESFTEFKVKNNVKPHNFYFYQTLEDLFTFVVRTTTDFCPELDSICKARIRSLYTAASLDLSFDTTSSALQINTLWPFRPQTIAAPASSERRTEVGLFIKNEPKSIKPHELGVAGLLTVLGESKKPSPSMFTFPSRHRQFKGDFSSKFLTPTGLHPTLQLTFSSNQRPAGDVDKRCNPYAYLTLPKTIFADRYQLADELFLASKNLTALRYTSLPVDLEAPAYTTDSWGSRVLLQLAPPSSDQDQPWTAEVPLHLRYMEPSSTGQADIEVPYPAVFWACGTEIDNLSNPFDREHLGYDELFDSEFSFWHVTPRAGNGTRLMNPVSVPVLNDQKAEWIGLGTSVAVMLGFAWVLWKLVGAMMSSGSHGQPKDVKVAKKKD